MENTLTIKDIIIKKRYPFYDPNIQQKDVELNGEQINNLFDDLIDEILEMYIPDGNPEKWFNKIQSLKTN